MSSQENKKRPSTSAAANKPAGKRSKYDPRNISAPPATVKTEGARRSARQLVPSASSSSSSSSTKSKLASSPGPGNRTVVDSSSSDEVFECALEVAPSQAMEMATTAKQQRRATAALLKEVRHTIISLSSLLFTASCSLFGIQTLLT